MFSFKNFTKSPLTTLSGALVGVIQAGVTSAAIQYSQNPAQVADWKPYAAAAASGAATFILGGLLGSGNSNSTNEIPLQGASMVEPIVPLALPSTNPVIQQAVDQAATQFILDKLGISDPTK